MKRFYFFLSCVFLSVFGTQAKEGPPVQISVVLGYSNLFPANRPFPLQIDLDSAKVPIEGEVWISCPDLSNGRNIYRLPVSILPGAHKQWRLTLPPISGNNIHVTLFDTSQRILDEQDFFGIQVAERSPLLVVVQDSGINRFSFPKDQNNDAPWRTASVSSKSLPDNPLAYMGVSVLCWRSEEIAPLTKTQSEALLAWVKQGGILVVSGGRTIPPNLPSEFEWKVRWNEFQPFSISALQKSFLSPPTRPLNLMAYVDSKVDLFEKGVFPSTTVAIKPLEVSGDFYSRLEINGLKLITEQIVGGGIFIQLAFDPMDFAREGYELDHLFWENLLWVPDPTLSLDPALRWFDHIGLDTNHYRLAETANYRISSVYSISWRFGLFFVFAFGLNFWSFRKSRRYEWAWLILLLCSIAVFFYNRVYGRVSSFGPTRHVELSRSYGIAGERSLLTFAETGILSPVSRVASVSNALPAQLLFGLDHDVRTTYLKDNLSTMQLQLNAGAFSTFSSISLDQLPGEGISAKWERKENDVVITLINKTGLLLEDLRIYPPVENNGSPIFPKKTGDEYTILIPNELFEKWINGEASQLDKGSHANFHFPGSSPLIEVRFEFSSVQQVNTKSDAGVLRSNRKIYLRLPIPQDFTKIKFSALKESESKNNYYYNEENYRSEY
jgi:hypothetical protein